MIKKVIKTRQAVSETQVRAAEGESDSNTMELVFTTGFKGLRHDFITFNEELEVTEKACDLGRLKAGAPVLLQHRNNVYEQIGVVEDAWIEKGLGYAKVRFSKRKEFEGIVTDIKERIIRNVSVGYDVHEFTETTKKGEEIPTLLATKWEPLEISFVAVGFDPGAQTTQRNNQTSTEVTIIPNGESQMTPEEQKALDDKAAADKKAAEDKAAEEQRAKDVADAKTAALKAVKERAVQIRSQVKTANLPSEFADSLIEKDLTAEQVSTEIFNEMERIKKQNTTTVTETVETKMTKREQALQALLYRANSTKYKIENIEANPLKGASLITIFEQIVERQKGESDQSYVKRAIVSADLANLLQNTANKILADNFAVQKPTYKLFTAPATLRDFKETPIVELSLFGLDDKNEGGDYEEAELLDTDEKVTLRERGIRFSISQKAIINDDLRALSQLPSKASFAGHADVEKAVYAILEGNPNMADGVALFHATHGNLEAAGTEPTVDQVALATAAMMEQETLDGEPLELRPKYIIVPPKYELAARKVAAAIVASSSADVNPFGGTLEVIVSGRITGDKWFLAADPNICAGIMTFTLEGMDEPVVSTDEHFRSSNLEMKVEYHNNAKAVNHKALYKVVVAP